MTQIDERTGINILSPIIGPKAAREILRHYDMGEIWHLDRRSLLRMRYIGPRKAQAILALPALLRCMVQEPVEGLSVSCSKDVFDLYHLRLASVCGHNLYDTALTGNQIL